MVVAAMGAFTSPPWPSTDPEYSSGTNKDVRVWQVYSSIVERVEAAGVTNYAAPQFYIYEREECIRYKAWVASNCQYFLNTSMAPGGSYDTWFSVNPGLPFPRWTITGIVAYLSLPTNYFTQTPWQQLSGCGWEITNEWTASGFSELDYGWKYATNIMAVLVWTEFNPHWYGANSGESIDCEIECDTRDLNFWPVVPSASCDVTLDEPTTGFGYISELSDNLYSVSGEGKILIIFSAGSDPDCENNSGSSWFYSSRDTETEFGQAYGRALVYANSGPHISSVTIAVDCYGGLGAWDAECMITTSAPLIRYETVAASTGNWVDTSGDLGNSFGEDWETNRVFIASEFWPQEFTPPSFNTNCVNSDIEENQGGDPCPTEAGIAFSNCFPGAEFNSTYGGAGGQRATKIGDFTTRKENTGAAVLKWNFNYK